MKTEKAALYARVSTREHDQNPETQLAQLRIWADRQGLETVEFTDYASGKDLNRPGWKAMISEVRRGRIDVVVVVRLDRAFRSVLDMSMTLEALEARGVRFAASTQDLDTGTATGRLLMHVLASVSQFERELTSERIKEGLARARREGRRGGRPRKVGDRRLKGAVDRLGVRGAARELGISPSAVSQRVKKTKAPNQSDQLLSHPSKG